MSGSEHSDNADLPLVASEYCLDPLVAPQCLLADPVNPLDSFRKWDATARAGARGHDAHASPPSAGSSGPRTASATSTSTSRATDANAKSDGGYATMDAVLRLVHARRRRSAAARTASRPSTTPAPKSLIDDRSRLQLERLRLRARGRRRGWSASRSSTTHERLRRSWYSRTRSTRAGTSARSAPRTSATSRTDDWGGPRWAKTVILAPDRSEPALKAAMLARRFYAIRRPGHRLTFTRRRARRWGRGIDPRRRQAELKVARHASTTRRRSWSSSRAAARSSRAAPATCRDARPPAPSERWYFVRALDAQGEPIAYSSPVWVDGAAARAPALASGSPATCTCTRATRTTPTAARTTTTPGRTSSTRSA